MKEILYTAQLKGKLKLSKFGDWYHEGKIFERKSLSDLFHRSLVWDAELKSYFVELGPQRATFDCEDTTFFVLALDDSKNPWQVTLAGGAQEPLNPVSLSLGDEDQIYCLVKGGHRARFTRAAHQQILKYVVDDSHINISGNLIKLARQ
ncbi:MAG: DUF1285 domain-containing protein [bacterium]|nr:DUF1285 domain-containing protein [bacterium]